MKKIKYILLSICAVCAALLLAFFVNILFKIRTDSILRAEWTAGDALNYVAAMTGAISTFVLSLIAYTPLYKFFSKKCRMRHLGV